MERHIVPRSCAVCGSLRKLILFKQEFVETACAPFTGYDVVVCQDCGFIFADMIPSQTDLDHYYAQMSKYEYRPSKEESLFYERIEHTANMIASILPKDAKILDIGCATGELLGALKERGYSHLTGLDPAAGAVEIAREIHQIDVSVGKISDIIRESFDVIILANVLEHIRYLDDVFLTLEECLAKGGKVVVEVPDVEGFTGEKSAPYQEFSTEHINFFTKTSLSNLFKRYGYTEMLGIRVPHGKGRYIPFCSVIKSIFEKIPENMEKDNMGEHCLREYIEHSLEQEKVLLEKIDKLDKSVPILIWGTGTHTLRLLAISSLRQVNIVGFVDSNINYHGKTILGLPIYSPSEVKERTESILIITQAYQEEISNLIRVAGMENEIIALHEREHK